MEQTQIWAPTRGEITFTQYLNYAQLAPGILGGVLRTTLSDQTKTLIANSDQLKRTFSHKFDELTGTLRWGFEGVTTAIANVREEVSSFHSDFNYYAGLIVTQLELMNRKLDKVIELLTSIDASLKTPRATQAREAFQLGRDRHSKGLLKQALTYYRDSESILPDEFFNQFYMGKLFLYGVNPEDPEQSVVNVFMAYEHLEQAATIAKAQMKLEPSFADYASDALFHTSLSLYFHINEPGYKLGTDPASDMLKKALQKSDEAASVFPANNEAIFHSAKYKGLLGNAGGAIRTLRRVIRVDRNYSIKVEFDPAFDDIRNDVLQLLQQERDTQLQLAKKELSDAEIAITELKAWKVDGSATLGGTYMHYADLLSQANSLYQTQTYFGLLDATAIARKVTTESNPLVKKHIDEVQKSVASICDAVDHRRQTIAFFDSTDVWSMITRARKLANEANDGASLQSAMSLAKSAEASAEILLARDQRLRQSMQFAFGGAITAFLTTLPITCIITGKVSPPLDVAFHNFLIIALISAIVGAIIGWFITPQAKEFLRRFE